MDEQLVWRKKKTKRWVIVFAAACWAGSQTKFLSWLYLTTGNCLIMFLVAVCPVFCSSKSVQPLCMKLQYLPLVYWPPMLHMLVIFANTQCETFRPFLSYWVWGSDMYEDICLCPYANNRFPWHRLGSSRRQSRQSFLRGPHQPDHNLAKAESQQRQVWPRHPSIWIYPANGTAQQEVRVWVELTVIWVG